MPPAANDDPTYTYSLKNQAGTSVATGNRQTITHNVSLQKSNQGDLVHWRNDGRIEGLYLWMGSEYHYQQIIEP